jgi:hypothetical protein
MSHITVELVAGGTTQVHTVADIDALLTADPPLVLDDAGRNAYAAFWASELDASEFSPADFTARITEFGDENLARVRRGATTPPSPTPTFTTGSLAAGLPTEVLSPREQSLLDQEAGPGGLETTFRQFLANQPFGQLSARGNLALQQQRPSALASFRLQGGPLQSFGGFLQDPNRGDFLSPAQIGRQLTDLGNTIPLNIPTDDVLGAGTVSGDEALLLQRFLSNQTAFETALDPLLTQVNPQFRGGVRSLGQRIFDRFQTREPENPFLRFLAQRGGNIFGAPSTANQFMGFN